MKKPKKPKLHKLVPKKLRKKQPAQPNQEQTLGEGVPRITNETVAAHREEVLGSARKYIYPLQHSKHKIVLISTALFITAFIAFFTYTMLALGMHVPASHQPLSHSLSAAHARHE